MTPRPDCLIALAVLAVAACGAEPEAVPQPEASADNRLPAVAPPLSEPEPAALPPEEFRDCTRGQGSEGVLSDLPGYRFERTAEYTEIEYGLLSVGPIRIVYSGCHYYVREYYFQVGEDLNEAPDADIFRRAAILMDAVADEAGIRSAGNMAREIEDLAAPVDFGLGEDLTGGMFEDDYGLGVSVESGGSGGSVLVVWQTFRL